MMGFGSYDESEQENQELETDEEESDAVSIHESEHDGDVNFESEMSTEDLIGKLDDMKDSSSDD
jgi:hypothetical protein